MFSPSRNSPCPSWARSDVPIDTHLASSKYGFDYEDDTANIEFTSEIKVSRPVGFKKQTARVRPRRPGKQLDFPIHNDDEPENFQRQPPTNFRSSASSREKSSVLAQPAQRPRLKPKLGSQNADALPLFSATTATEKSHQTGSIISKASRSQIEEQDLASHDKKTHRPARRRTVYIPAEDTTMPTVWMGVFSPDEESNALGKEKTSDLTGIAAQMAQKRRSRKSSAMPAPRRGPLTQARRPPQEKAIKEDIAGQLTGKENVPPGHASPGSAKVKKREPLFDSSKQVYDSSQRSEILPMKRARQKSFPKNNTSVIDDLSVPASQSRQPRRLSPHVGGAVLRDDVNRSSVPSPLKAKEYPALRDSDSNIVVAKNQPLPLTAKTKSPVKPLAPSTNHPLVNPSYPVLSKDDKASSLYEESWLRHQEIAITKLFNNLFDTTRETSHTSDILRARPELLAIYQNQPMVLLHKRLQASLLYGSLGASPATLVKSSKLGEDLATKQRFLDLWLDTYDLRALQACAEVVIGRECSIGQRDGLEAESYRHPSGTDSLRHSLSQYLEQFLIRDKDRKSGSRVLDSDLAGVQWTLLRSLMLIKLLDDMKSLPHAQIQGLLFQTSSRYKSSATAVQALIQQLQPSIGNALRSLGHLGYVVSHVQQPLEEYEYRLENLAVDFRDGVRLTRLAEILVYPSLPEQISAGDGLEVTTTIVMPEGDTLSLVGNETDRPLSQHLKFPCHCRATKVYNCQIALSALKGVDGINKIVKKVQAEDIVDGFREKTVALLWGLASKWRLGDLIDWVDVEMEVRRMGGTISAMNGRDQDDGFMQHKDLLWQWAAASASKKALTVHSQSTSFADGRVFEAIVDEYEPFLAAPQCGNETCKATPQPLNQRLVALGCSDQFASLFSPDSSIPTGSSMSSSSTSTTTTPTTILDHDFTFACLAFLASRLLSASKPSRAAIVIQRSWRRRLVPHRREAEQRRLVAWAKAVIWGAWTRYRYRTR